MIVGDQEKRSEQFLMTPQPVEQNREAESDRELQEHDPGDEPGGDAETAPEQWVGEGLFEVPESDEPMRNGDHDLVILKGDRHRIEQGEDAVGGEHREAGRNHQPAEPATSVAAGRKPDCGN